MFETGSEVAYVIRCFITFLPFNSVQPTINVPTACTPEYGFLRIQNSYHGHDK
jgi:hypothetical protein